MTGADEAAILARLQPGSARQDDSMRLATIPLAAMLSFNAGFVDTAGFLGPHRLLYPCAQLAIAIKLDANVERR